MSKRPRRQLELFDTEPAHPTPRAPATAPTKQPEVGGLARRSGPSDPPGLSDQRARRIAVDPTRNVVLEASAGTGKTSVLVARYLNLLRADVDPANVLAITFTRQAAAELRARIVQELKADAARSRAGRVRWLELRDRLSEITISTIDAFCLSLLREFPLEADLDPGFTLADDTELPRIVQQAAEHALVVGSTVARDDANVAMLLAQLGPWRTRVALVHLLRRRLVIPGALRRYLSGTPASLDADEVCRDAATALADRLEASDTLDRLLVDGPAESGRFSVVARDLTAIRDLARRDPARIRAALDRLRGYFLTLKGKPRRTFSDRRLKAGTPRHRRFRDAAIATAPIVHDVLARLDRDLNVALVRGVQRLFSIAVTEYRRELESRALLDFSDVLARAVELLRQMDEFARSRYRLESRYHHVLVDEFQDTSRAQWELVSLLVQSWGEGSGLVHDAPLPPSVFVVGDRKQSIYRFRDADVAVLEEAATDVTKLRDTEANGVDPANPSDPSDPLGVRQSISHSFRAVPHLLAFINDLFAAVDKAPGRRDAFRFDPPDHFPLDDFPRPPGEPLLGVALSHSVEACAERVAGEVARLLDTVAVRDRNTGQRRSVAPHDIAVLFRSRESHREFEQALGRRGIPTCVYKGLGFFDTDEIKDTRTLLRYLANPTSELRAAAFLRSRFIGVSDHALAELAGALADALVAAPAPEIVARLADDDRRLLELARVEVPRWLSLVDRLPPSEVLDHVIAGSAYVVELGTGPAVQERENIKKIRALVRRAQNRGYGTMSRIADHIDHLSGDVANAIVDAFDAVNLMTVHAAKGLEFPVVMLVDLGRGTGTQLPPIRVVTDRASGQPSVSVWPFRTAADDDERLRDLEESKRLLYVAATRARDRLYFSAVTDGDRIKINRGSLGEVLPTAFVSTMERAIGADGAFEWVGQSGHAHRFAVLGAPTDPAPKNPSRIRNTV